MCDQSGPQMPKIDPTYSLSAVHFWSALFKTKISLRQIEQKNT